jgi:hypothetical protein
MFQSALLVDDDVPFGLRASVEAALRRMPPPTWGTTLPTKLQEMTATLLAGTNADADLLTVPASSGSPDGDNELTIYEVSLI